MSSIVVAIEHLSLDGVFQAPGRADEDERGGFDRGGWAAETDTAEMQTVIGRHMNAGWSLLVGTTTYEDLREAWHHRQPAHPMTKALTSVRKFVVSRDQGYQLEWDNSTLVPGEGTETLPRLKAEQQRPLIIFGSGELVRSLMRGGLVDELVLMIHPLVLAKGRRLFDETAGSARLRLSDSTTTTTGVVVATYKPA